MVVWPKNADCMGPVTTLNKPTFLTTINHYLPLFYHCMLQLSNWTLNIFNFFHLLPSRDIDIFKENTTNCKSFLKKKYNIFLNCTYLFLFSSLKFSLKSPTLFHLKVPTKIFLIPIKNICLLFDLKRNLKKNTSFHSS